MKAVGLARTAAGILPAGICCICILAAATSARAEDEPDLFGQVAPGIARLNLSGFASRTQCTAVQFGRRGALAVGFCLQGGRFDRAHLLFGYDRGEWQEGRSPYSAFSDPAQVLLKLLCLDRGLPPSRFKQENRPLAVGDRVFVAGYAAPKSETLTFRGCAVSRAVRRNEFNIDCDPGPGSAGSPVFRRSGTSAALLGVLAAPSPTGSLVLGWSGGNPDDLCPYSPN